MVEYNPVSSYAQSDLEIKEFHDAKIFRNYQPENGCGNSYGISHQKHHLFGSSTARHFSVAHFIMEVCSSYQEVETMSAAVVECLFSILHPVRVYQLLWSIVYFIPRNLFFEFVVSRNFWSGKWKKIILTTSFFLGKC